LPEEVIKRDKDQVHSEVQLQVNGAAPLVGSASAISSHGRATLGSAREGSRYKVGAGFVTSSLRHSYSGLVDEVRVYDRALTDEEANQLAAETPEPAGSLKPFLHSHLAPDLVAAICCVQSHVSDLLSSQAISQDYSLIVGLAHWTVSMRCRIVPGLCSAVAWNSAEDWKYC
jgi:hypothetical protein